MHRRNRRANNEPVSDEPPICRDCGDADGGYDGLCSDCRMQRHIDAEPDGYDQTPPPPPELDE